MVGAALTVLLLLHASAVAQPAGSAAWLPRAVSEDFSGLVEIGGGRRLYLECRGTGTPTVILEAGAGNNGQTWDTAGLPAGSTQTAVLPGVARFTRVCAYDRPGTILDPEHLGRSDPAPMPRTAGAIVDDLHRLLVAANVPGPYVLAGHSFGGLVARLYAATYPDEVVGLVLIDAAHEDYYAAQQAALAPEQRDELTRLADEGPPELAGHPDFERLDTSVSAAEVREAVAASPLRPMPEIVLTHGRPWEWPEGYPAADLEALWMPLQEQLAALTPQGRLVVAEQSGHFIPGDQPGLAIEAIKEVVEAVRNPASWSAGAGAATPVPAAAQGWQLTPLLDHTLFPPAWFTGSDGQVHLVAELLLTNALPVPVTISSVEVLDTGSGASLVRLDGEALLASMSLATSPETPAVALPPASVGVAWLDVPLASAQAVPAAVSYRLTIEPPEDVPVADALLAFTTEEVAVDQRPPVVLGPPLAGAGWAALGSCCDGPHRRALQPINGQWFLAQRFAIDFNQLDARNRPGVGDPALPTSFPTFGQPVLAVADATVVEAVDRYPDLLVGEAREDLNAQTAGGNRVVLDLGDGRFAIYAHLHAGSVSVQAGDQVRQGQVIAAVGSSGTGGGPHLHFQVTDRPSVLFGSGLPFVFDHFELTGQTPPLAEVLPYYDSLEPIPVTPDRTGPREGELPLGRDVVTFPPVPASAAAAAGDFAGLVDIGGGRKMFLQCQGEGGPTVVLISGFGNPGGAWTVLPDGVASPAVLPGAAGFTRVCAYDRPGTLLDAAPPDDRSRSDPIPQPTTATAMVADLHALLTAAEAPGPYVLAGHSFGGLIARLYAATYPDEVAGIILVDAFSEGVRAGLPAEDWQTWTATNGVPSPELLALEPNLEQTDINAAADAMEQAAAASPLRAVPLFVLSAGRTGEMTAEQAAALPPGYPEALETALRSNAVFLAGLVPDARLMIVPDSGHYIQAEKPELVIEAIRQVVEGVRHPATWEDLVTCCTP
ncbi:MAG: alpha/beta fold hydrolase [Thermomicrobiales bacterium]